MTKEEAIEVYNGLINVKIKEAFEFFAPELRESENERIRNEIEQTLTMFVADNDSSLHPGAHYTVNEAIAWLEKQKECVVDSNNTSTDEDEKIRKGLISYLEIIAGDYFGEFKKSDIIAYLEKQKEQKPVDDGTRAKIISRATSEKQVVLVSESDGNAEIGWDTRSLEDARNLLEYGILFINKQLGVKPAEWSKNDTAFLNEITDFLENKTSRLQHDLDMYAHWLKSLPEKIK